MFRNRQQLRRWAARLLFLWLFGAGASTANACLTTGEPGPVGTMAGHPVLAMVDQHDAVPHDHAQLGTGGLQEQHVESQHHQDSAAKANCHARTGFRSSAVVGAPPGWRFGPADPDCLPASGAMAPDTGKQPQGLF